MVAKNAPDDSTPPPTLEKETPAEATLFRSLGNPLRRQLLRFIAEKRIVSYSDLRDTFRLEPGTLYFHLEQLMSSEAPLLQQTTERRYQITHLGEVAANFLVQATDITPSTAPPQATGTYPHLRRLTHFLGFAPLFRYLTSRTDRLLLEAAILLGLFAYLVTLVPLLLVGFLPFDLFILSPYHPALSFLASWFLIAAASELLMRLRYHTTTGFLALLSATVYAWIPQVLYALLRLFFAPLLTALPLLTFLLLFGALTWSLWIYTLAITHTKRLAIRKAALTTIIITNITILATILLTLLQLFL